MRTYWNTYKKDLLVMLEEDEQIIQQLREKDIKHNTDIQAQSKWASLIKHVTNILIWNDDSESLNEMETPEGTIYVIYPTALQGKIRLTMQQDQKV